MSGGSYNYLYSRSDVGDLMDATNTLREMSDKLAGLGYAADAAAETESLLLILRQVQNRIGTMQQRLAPVWKAVEWWQSCDTSEDGVKKCARRVSR